jgi:ABC-type multidrug transport system ATPase subunit
MDEYQELSKDQGTFDDIDLSWENLRCSVKTDKGEKHILKGVSGYALHGEFLVLMGSSGAGKTTLLNILSRRLEKSSDIQISGSVFANSQSIEDISYENYIGYVTQEDLLIPTMTVFECLLFVTRLKTKYNNKKERVNELISLLKLEKCKNTLIGNHYIKGVSGGEKKRVSIGMELITNPSIIFLDELTSGLDSYTALIVTKILLDQAKLGKTIITTIHQPSSEIFYLFDKLILMADGQFVYQGPAKESINFFKNCGYECPPLSNPADFYMEILSISNTNQLTDQEQSRINTFITANNLQESKVITLQSPLATDQVYVRSFSYQLAILTQRSFNNAIRHPLLGLIRIIGVLVLASVISALFWQIGSSTLEDLNNRAAIVNFCIVAFGSSNNIITSVTFPSQFPIFQKEYQSNMYGLVPYFLSICIIEAIYDFLLTLVIVSSLYWSVGLNTNSSKPVFFFYLLTYLSMFGSGSVGHFGGALIQKPEVSVFLSGVIVQFFTGFTGFYRGKGLPSGTKWIENISLYFYLYQAAIRTQFENFEFDDCYICEEPGNCTKCDPFYLYNIRIELFLAVTMAIVVVICLRLSALSILWLKVRKLRSYSSLVN